ncbi:MAG: hypothetical protein HXS52_11080 [Theionarchaea archaeon]|nr:hypothetical protein [Theionarchaea archaeon]
MNDTRQKRPTGLSIVSVLWILWGVLNLFLVSLYVNADLSVMSSASYQTMHEWLRFALPAELALNLTAFAASLVMVFAGYGLLTGKSWSYKLTLAIVLVPIILNSLVIMLYLSAPTELNFSGSAPVMRLPFGLIWVALLWIYLRRDNVKMFLGVR